MKCLVKKLGVAIDNPNLPVLKRYIKVPEVGSTLQPSLGTFVDGVFTPDSSSADITCGLLLKGLDVSHRYKLVLINLNNGLSQVKQYKSDGSGWGEKYLTYAAFEEESMAFDMTMTSVSKSLYFANSTESNVACKLCIFDITSLTESQLASIDWTEPQWRYSGQDGLVEE